MLADPHTFRCFQCTETFEALGLDLLCALVNDHNRTFHPTTVYTTWAPSSIRFSNFYRGPDSPTVDERYQAAYPDARPEYTKRWGTANGEWGKTFDGKVMGSPVITAEDRAWLAENKIKW